MSGYAVLQLRPSSPRMPDSQLYLPFMYLPPYTYSATVEHVAPTCKDTTHAST